MRGIRWPQGVVPVPEAHEGAQGGHDGFGLGQVDRPVDAELAGAVDLGGVDQFIGDVLDELAHQEHRLRVGNSGDDQARSEEHTSELQSRFDLVCSLLLEKKNIYMYHAMSVKT